MPKKPKQNKYIQQTCLLSTPSPSTLFSCPQQQNQIQIVRAVEICANVAICVAVAVADVVAAPGGVDGPVCSAVAVCVCVCV